MRILLVEDDASLGDTILSWLKMDQYAVDWVRRGDSAQTALMTHSYDCVLLDRGLPGLSGDALLTHAGIALHPDSRQVTLDDTPLTLTAREFHVLYALLLRKHSIVSRAQIEEALYGWGDEVESNAIEVYIHNLRKKLGAAHIVTVRGLGYRLKTDGD